MAGTLEGGKKAATKNLAKNPNFYKEIGAKGGRNGRTGGFAANPELARKAGSLGGKKSKRGKSVAKAPVVLQDNSGLEPTPEKKKKLWIF